ncbi:mitogen-activated protein kinase 15 isoform X3 [Thamnophis elegans]|uniref:mitogen-activated protein kinase 15 isoform X3 n=1 Tax=Thamnophis elegans TaxID=35005 RepID=UPI001378A8A4|nr:mitogen-activated protein kinase 15 isoform X3 [Thamnophis elegans]
MKRKKTPVRRGEGPSRGVASLPGLRIQPEDPLPCCPPEENQSSGSKERAEGTDPSPRLKKLNGPPEGVPPRGRAPFSSAPAPPGRRESPERNPAQGGSRGHTGEGTGEAEGEGPRGRQRAGASAGRGQGRACGGRPLPGQPRLAAAAAAAGPEDERGAGRGGGAGGAALRDQAAAGQRGLRDRLEGDRAPDWGQRGGQEDLRRLPQPNRRPEDLPGDPVPPETDLHAVIKKGNLLKDIHKCYILYQLLKATKFIHSGNVIHRDQKPSNILLDRDCFVKLCDFGLARSLGQIERDEGNPALTEYVATRWYRAPEILLASKCYTKGVDMWSIGCILGEMLLGKPLFPGTSTVNQIEQILRVIPPPSAEDVEAFHSDYQTSVINRVSCQPQLSLEELLPASTPAQALDLLKRLLVFNPEKRLTAEEALQHPYVQRFHCAAKEPALDYSVTLPLADDVQLSVAEYRNRVYELILEWKASSQAEKQPLQGDALPSGSTDAAGSPLRAHCPMKGGTQLLPSHGSPPPFVAASQRRANEPRNPCPKPKFSSTVCSPTVNAAAQNFLPAGNVAMGQPPSHLRQYRRAAGTSALWDAQEAALNQHLTRKGAVPSRVAMGLIHPESRGREAHFFLKPCKKMFQVTANVGIAGDPKAHLGSYSQSYGTICKSALQNLPVSGASRPVLAPSPQQL